MPPVKSDFDLANLYFITTTTVHRAHLLKSHSNKQIIIDSFGYMRLKKWIKLYAFVVMPNHVHLIVRFIGSYNLSDVIREFKKHTSKQIINHAQAESNHKMLSYLEKAAETIKDQHYKVWEDGYDARDVFSLPFLQQKMDYLHNNPCQPQWRLVDQPEDYIWSSACFYILGKPPVIPIDDVREYLIP
ncbi:transposase [Chloroflexota bacterium]